jgi:anti-sigma B factor antagonist
MTIDKKLENGTWMFAVARRLDTNTAPELEAELKLDGAKEVVFDFGGLEYISSAGLRVLMTAHKAMAAAGGGVKVLRPNAMVRGVFEITGLSSVFVVEP